MRKRCGNTKSRGKDGLSKARKRPKMISKKLQYRIRYTIPVLKLGAYLYVPTRILLKGRTWSSFVLEKLAEAKLSHTILKKRVSNRYSFCLLDPDPG